MKNSVGGSQKNLTDNFRCEKCRTREVNTLHKAYLQPLAQKGLIAMSRTMVLLMPTLGLVAYPKFRFELVSWRSPLVTLCNMMLASDLA